MNVGEGVGDGVGKGVGEEVGKGLGEGTGVGDGAIGGVSEGVGGVPCAKLPCTNPIYLSFIEQISDGSLAHARDERVQ